MIISFKSIIRKYLPSSFIRYYGKLRSHRIKRKNVGARSYIDPSVQVIGWNNVRVGENTVISQDSWINVNHRNNDEVSVDIGSHSLIGRRNFFSSGDYIKIGPYCLTGVDCRFLGAGHDYASPFIPYAFAKVSLGGGIDIGANCWLGAGVTILKNVRIGYGSVIGAGSVVTSNIPPLSMAFGSPHRIVKRYSLNRQRWVQNEEYKEGEDALLTPEEYIEILKLKYGSHRVSLYTSGPFYGDI